MPLPEPCLIPPDRYLQGPLFKYTKRDYAKTLVSQGDVLIGTLWGYDDINKLGKAIGDNGEGTHTRKIENFLASGDHDSPERQALQRELGMEFSPGSVFLGGTIKLEHRVPNCYVYCVGREWNENVLSRWNQDRDEKDKYDACVIIEHPYAFFCALTHALKRLKLISANTQCDVDNCQYISKRESDMRDLATITNRDIHFTKVESEHGWQSEVRAIWKPAQAIKNAEKVIAPEVIPFCKIYALLE